MRRHAHYLNLEPSDRGACVAIGNFDGVHLGHQSVIGLARAAAGALNAPLGVVTFEPHPRNHFAPDAPPFRLMNAEARAHRLEKLGVQQLYELPFDGRMAAMTADHFVAEILVAGLGVRHVVVGADFHFGRGRRGDAYLLQALGRSHRFEVTIAPLVGNATQDFSSTAIRKALTDGSPEEAARMLGHWHRIEGRVVKGDQRGRDLGFPTANMGLDGLHLPRFGVYAVTVEVLDGPHKGHYRGASSLGERPTFGVNAPNLETHLLDFEGDLYGAELSVALVEFLRPELKFDDVDALVRQMHQDVTEARAALDRAGL
ncbi:bifunctional riboflavin kinase/FAD synthetase [Halovulum dunhuangense]|uniref:Riboflavin biosynthesis protein n=1 Tax=Halovulum dunhuangense TaxID=1505036 RepID=A0A849KV52_9RHOB|nr:bifunctional riboflavin kinase/FAD synthetase [Halovulum dunhuangense]NNU79521.1 bifunctional riboflavin kinase/FAD synthetase [Halovulum dunhuangense]